MRLGTVLADGAGTFTGSWQLPPSVVPKQCILQVIGTLSTGATFTVNTGLIVRKADRRSIIITGYRGTKANAGKVFVYARTWDINGEQVRARVKLQGQTTYARGSSRVVQDGSSLGSAGPARSSTSTSSLVPSGPTGSSSREPRVRSRDS